MLKIFNNIFESNQAAHHFHPYKICQKSPLMLMLAFFCLVDLWSTPQSVQNEARSGGIDNVSPQILNIFCLREFILVSKLLNTIGF